MDLFDDPKKSMQVALGLGALGGPLVAIGAAIDSSVVLIIGVIVLMASGVTWAVRGVKEDEAKEAAS